MAKLTEGYSEKCFIKLYDSVLDDRDMQSRPPEQFRFLVNCWLLARRSGNPLGTAYEIAFKLRMRDEEAVRLCQELKDYLHMSACGKVEVKDWDYWQGKQTSTPRVKAHREKRKAEFSTDETLMKRNETDETNTNVSLFHETFVKHDETLEKKRKEEKRKEDGGAVAPAHHQPEFPDFEPGPSVEQLVSEAVESVAQFWPRIGDKAYAKAAWAKHAATDAQGPAAWCEKVKRDAVAHAAAWDRKLDLDPKAFVPTLERWVAKGDYMSPPERVRGGTQLRDKSRVCSRCEGLRTIFNGVMDESLTLKEIDALTVPCPECAL